MKSTSTAVDTTGGAPETVATLAQWITREFPQIPLLGCGSAEYLHAEQYVTLFRKILSVPISVDHLFHVLVNLFSPTIPFPSSHTVDIVSASTSVVATSASAPKL